MPAWGSLCPHGRSKLRRKRGAFRASRTGCRLHLAGQSRIALLQSWSGCVRRRVASHVLWPWHLTVLDRPLAQPLRMSSISRFSCVREPVTTIVPGSVRRPRRQPLSCATQNGPGSPRFLGLMGSLLKRDVEEQAHPHPTPYVSRRLTVDAKARSQPVRRLEADGARGCDGNSPATQVTESQWDWLTTSQTPRRIP